MQLFVPVLLCVLTFVSAPDIVKAEDNTVETSAVGNETAVFQLRADTVYDCLKSNGVSDAVIIQPNNPLYSGLYPPRNKLFVTKPVVVVLAQSTSDVVGAVKCGRQTNTKVIPRGGGHSFGGTSSTSGILVSFDKFKTITGYNPNTGEVTWQPGKRQGDVMVSLYKMSGGKHIFPGGVCASVGAAGWLAVGGIGFFMRSFGLGNDNLKSFQLVTADAKVLTVSATQNSDLFWARYMCGPQFGIMTSITYQAQLLPPKLTIIEVSYNTRADTKTIIKLFHDWIPKQVTEKVNCVLRIFKGGSALLQCLSLLPMVQTDQLFYNPLFAKIPAGKTKTHKEGGYADYLGVFGYTERGGNSLDAIQNDQLEDVAVRKKEIMHSRIITQPFSDAVIDKILDAYAASPVPKKISFKAMGGVIPRNRNNNFPYRDAASVMYYQHDWNDANDGFYIKGYADFENVLDSIGVSKTQYCGYQDVTSKDWQQRAWGSNLPKMKNLKTKYDPTRLFHTSMDL